MVTKWERGEELGDWDSHIRKTDDRTAQGALLSILH